MRDIDGRAFLSASDLMRFMGCTHATTLDLAQMRGTGPKPREDSEDAALLQKQGNAHEAAHLARLNAAGRGIVEITRGTRLDVAVSRAKGLALAFGAPRLREAKCETVEQMRLVNTLCALNKPCSPRTLPSSAISSASCGHENTDSMTAEIPNA
ncbi:hypothetical protein PSQ90_15430 [Devosia rhodophyticola]|uniref:Uncharacterized protein n=1 Tax=Devosia rhodophyticola TaxID=3026423 RepID=A0ABY7YWT1_9HYPH|nr:hypothetical protein [Devosia rhodophyticola]WDR05637.1 hypothetical protein PSQ90_15430 [Devosia rhodophyticola]